MEWISIDNPEAVLLVEGNMDWISVEDRMPEAVGLNVLAFTGNRQCVAFRAGGALWLQDKPEKAISVTHWMPLPDPPKTNLSTAELAELAERVRKLEEILAEPNTVGLAELADQLRKFQERLGHPGTNR